PTRCRFRGSSEAPWPGCRARGARAPPARTGAGSAARRTASPVPDTRGATAPRARAARPSPRSAPPHRVLLHGILDRAEQTGGVRAVSPPPPAAWTEGPRAQPRLLGPDHVAEIRIADVDSFLRRGARRAHAELEDSRVGLRDPDHAGIDDELQMRGE